MTKYSSLIKIKCKRCGNLFERKLAEKINGETYCICCATLTVNKLIKENKPFTK